MTETTRRPQIVNILILTIILVVAGCSKRPDYRDQRLADMAKQTVAEQVKQNSRMAEQSEAVIKQSHQLAEASRELVAKDAEARQELIAAQHDLTTQLNKQQSKIDLGREQLETGRREIAQQRHRDPIVAEAVGKFGIVIACLMPLLVAIWVISRLGSEEPDHAAVAELLTLELTADQPRLLPDNRAARFPPPEEPSAQQQVALDQVADNSADDNDLPF